MPHFSYRAKNKMAHSVSGYVSALNREEAVEKIHHMDLVPVHIEETSVHGQQQKPVKTGRVRQRELFLFSRQLVNLLKAGIPLLRALELMGAQLRNAYFKYVIEDIHALIRGGKAFSECLAEYPKIFPPLYAAMVRAGEEGGNLKESIGEMTGYLREQHALRSKVKSAVVYPVLMLVFGIGTVIFILTYVMPQIMELFGNLDQALPWPTVLVMGISSFLRQWGWLVAIGLLISAAFLRKTLSTKPGRRAVSQMQLQIPFLRSFVMNVELTRFSQTLALLLKSGISIVRALQLAIPVIENECVREQFVFSQEQLMTGRSFGESLQQTELIPQLYTHMMRVGEESGSLVTTLEDIGATLQQETTEYVKVLTTLIEPLMILGIGSIIGFIVIAMLLPIFQMEILAG